MEEGARGYVQAGCQKGIDVPVLLFSNCVYCHLYGRGGIAFFSENGIV